MRSSAGLARSSLLAAGLSAALAAPASADDINTFRRQHGRAPLSMSGTLAALAQSHAHGMAARGRLDHANFRARLGAIGGTHAENVAWGNCESESCAIRQWSRSGRHRANMLRKDVSAYGIASADGGSGRRYWVLELGN